MVYTQAWDKGPKVLGTLAKVLITSTPVVDVGVIAYPRQPDMRR
jgi:hypothetical protein